MASMRVNSIEGPEKTTNYKNIKDFKGVDAILRESDNGLRLVAQKYVSITSATTNFKTDRATIVAKNETPKMDVNLAVSPASGFNVPEQYQAQQISDLIKQSAKFNDSIMQKNLKKDPKIAKIYDKIERKSKSLMMNNTLQ